MSSELASGLSQMRLGSFQYRRLDPETDGFRLLILHSHRRPSDDTLRCEIKHYPLESDDRPEYEAISHAWGDPNPCKLVKVGHRDLYVSVNTETALRCLAYPDRERVLWIDAVCIDQKNDAERSQQVAKMGSIYRHAKRGLVYLGEADEHTKRALDDIEMLEREKYEDLGSNDMWSVRNQMFTDVTYLKPVRSQYDDEALVRLFCRPWFTRLWVFQEVKLAHNPLLVCGEHEFDMTRLLAVGFWLYLWHSYNISPALFFALRSIRVICFGRQEPSASKAFFFLPCYELPTLWMHPIQRTWSSAYSDCYMTPSFMRRWSPTTTRVLRRCGEMRPDVASRIVGGL